MTRTRPGNAYQRLPAPQAEKMCGTNVHPTFWDPNTGPTAAQRLAVMNAYGITHARFDVPWSLLQTTSGGPLTASYISRIDAFVTGCSAVGITPLAVVTRTPGWANGNASDLAPPAANSTYTSFLNTVQSRWAGAVREWEIWNEPSSSSSWVGGTVDRYGSLLQASYAAAKSVDPGCTVLGGSLHQTNAQTAQDFLRDLLAGGYGQYMDVLSVHSYGDPPNHGSRWPWECANDVGKLIGPVMAAGGLTCPVWLTESGYNTAQPGGFSSAFKQAAAVKDLNRHSAAVGLARCYAYEFFDSGTDTANVEQCYGIAYRNTMRLKTLP